MRLTSVAADGFKNLKAIQFSPSPHYNLIIGENAQGKTNLLEAIWMMTGWLPQLSGHTGTRLPLHRRIAAARCHCIR